MHLLQFHRVGHELSLSLSFACPFDEHFPTGAITTLKKGLPIFNHLIAGDISLDYPHHLQVPCAHTLKQNLCDKPNTIQHKPVIQLRHLLLAANLRFL